VVGNKSSATGLLGDAAVHTATAPDIRFADLMTRPAHRHRGRWGPLPVWAGWSPDARVGSGSGAAGSQPARWRPHVTIGYSTSGQPAKPIIDALGTHLPGCDIDIDALSRVIQRGPERAWDWSIVSTIRLAAPART
jgi:hypothetical protein